MKMLQKKFGTEQVFLESLILEDFGRRRRTYVLNTKVQFRHILNNNKNFGGKLTKMGVGVC